MVKVSGIYKIVHVATGRCYVGQSVDVKRRLSGHKKMLKQGKHHSPHLQHCWDKYGSDAFEFILVENCDAEGLTSREQFWIDNLNSTFNVCRIAQSTKGLAKRPETIEKLRIAALNMSVETREKMSAAGKRKRLSEEHKRKIGAAVKGSKRSDETKRRLSAAAMGNKRTLGFKWSEESRAKRRGKRHSEETLAKMSISNKTAWAIRKEAEK